jgi:hypothetical protein
MVGFALPPFYPWERAGWTPRTGMDDVEKRTFLTVVGLEIYSSVI